MYSNLCGSLLILRVTLIQCMQLVQYRWLNRKNFPASARQWRASKAKLKKGFEFLGTKIMYFSSFHVFSWKIAKNWFLKNKLAQISSINRIAWIELAKSWVNPSLNQKLDVEQILGCFITQTLIVLQNGRFCFI